MSNKLVYYNDSGAYEGGDCFTVCSSCLRDDMDVITSSDKPCCWCGGDDKYGDNTYPKWNADMDHWLHFDGGDGIEGPEWWDGEPDIYSNPNYFGAAIDDQLPNFSISGEIDNGD